MSGRHLGIAAASACAALLALPGIAAAAPTGPTVSITALHSQPATDDPYITQCLDGGLAMWSDGTTSYSEWCANSYDNPQDQGGGTPGSPNVPLQPGPGVPFGPEGML